MYRVTDVRDYCQSMDTYSNGVINTNQLAVNVNKVEFEYRNNSKTLDKLSLKIPKGKIFALLGPNGCGKTTLIRSILGRLKLKSGSITVFGVRPGSRYSDIPGEGVGYMPQELALFEEFTIREILEYYGTVYHLKGEELKNRIKNLMEILNLPEDSRLISRLSGGQQRRVSIAITMIHKPKLIILDEPTVGVDSLLRCRIWKYLEDICSKYGQTVLITTHYIEEAKTAANVAFMNSGTVLEQSDPQLLLKEYKCITLEQVFLILCQQQDKCSQSSESRKSIKNGFENNHKFIDKTEEENENEFINNNNYNKNQINEHFIDFMRIKAMLIKYFRLTKRRPYFLFMYFFIPIIALTTMKLSVGQSPYDIPVAVYNGDLQQKHSTLFIDSIDTNYLTISDYSDNQTAFQSVVDGKNYVSIVFTQNFSEAFDARLADIFALPDEDIDATLIKVYMDFSNVAIGTFVLKYLIEAFKKFLDTLSPYFGYDLYRSMAPVNVDEVIYGTLELDITAHFGPSALILCAHFLPLVLSSFQIVFDRKKSSFERILVAGVKPNEYYIAHMVQNILYISTMLASTMFVAFVLFDFTQMGSYLEVYIMLELQGILGISIGLMGALVLSDEVSVAVGISGTMLPIWIMSGVLWPLESIPTYFRWFSDLTPISQPLDSLRSVMLRGWSCSRSSVLYGYLFSGGYTLLINIFNIILFNIYSDKAFKLHVFKFNN